MKISNKDKNRFIENVNWFNQYFDGVYQLFERISQILQNDYSLPEKMYYYYKANSKPSIPGIYLLGLGSEDFAIQIYAIFNLNVFSSQSYFLKEPSIIVLKHSHGKRYGWYKEYGLKIIINNGIEFENNEGDISGKIIENQANFFAFQVPFDYFTEGEDIENSIHEKILKKLKNAPKW